MRYMNLSYKQLVLCVVMLFNVCCTVFFQGYGLLGSVLFTVFTLPLWSHFYRRKERVTSESIKADWQYFIHESIMRVIFPLFFHLFIWVKIGWSTVVDHLFEAYVISAFSGYILAYFTKRLRPHISVFSVSIVPSVVSMFLIVNFVFSSEPYQETYKFVAPANSFANRQDSDFFTMAPRILLEGQAYHDYPGVRTFSSRAEFHGNHVTYTFEKGLFGFAVVKDYRFFRVIKQPLEEGI